MADDIVAFLDRQRVSETVTRYFRALDRFDWASVEQLVTDPFTLVPGVPGLAPVTSSRAEFLADLIARNGGFESTLHVNAGHVVNVNGDTAHLSAQMIASHIVGPGPDEWFGGYGFYEIDLERVDGEWNLRRLEIAPIRGEGANPGAIYAVAAQRQKDGLGHP